MKVCKNCKYFKKRNIIDYIFSLGDHKCKKAVYNVTSVINGKTFKIIPSCLEMRGKYEKCKPDGLLFERKEKKRRLKQLKGMIWIK